MHVHRACPMRALINVGTSHGLATSRSVLYPSLGWILRRRGAGSWARKMTQTESPPLGMEWALTPAHHAVAAAVSERRFPAGRRFSPNSLRERTFPVAAPHSHNHDGPPFPRACAAPGQSSYISRNTY